MRLFTKTKALIRSEDGIMAALVAVFITGFVALMGASIDLGIVYSAHAQLQSAADSAALAAAGELVKDLDGDGFADSNYGGSEAAAHSYVAFNEMLKNQLIWTDADTFEAGLWDFGVKDFTRLGDSGDPNDLTAARVTLRRSVGTFFARIVGIHQVDISATTTGFLGYAGNGGKGDLPIAVNIKALDGPGKELNLNPENAENIQWTSYSIDPANTPILKDLTNYPETIPSMNIGDEMNLNNGVEVPVLVAVKNAYDANKDADGKWHVVIPVVEWTTPSTLGTLKGFVHYVITGVETSAADKGISGYWYNGGDLVLEGAASGGGDYGVRATRATLVN